MNLEALFHRRKDDPVWNTSYPLLPRDWEAYRTDGPLPFEGERELSFYVHIPFCRRLCAFCEYARMLCPSADRQRAYVEAVGADIRAFLSRHDGFTLRGFDIGGGTPTALSAGNLSRLLDIYDETVDGLTLAPDFEPSIEGTFRTLTDEKLRRIARSGIRRLSLGLQSASRAVLRRQNREDNPPGLMEEKLALARRTGITKVNLDLMYGLASQSSATIEADLAAVRRLSPEQVTLYELRPNCISAVCPFSKDELYHHYTLFFDGLSALGYKARFGQNTFTKDAADEGVSSYLRSRMLEGASYKGFGLSAQSMSCRGVSYNVGKVACPDSTLLARSTFGEQDTYLLPPEELAAKYIAISAYHGSFSLKHLSRMLGCDAVRHYEAPTAFCLQNGLMEPSGDRLCITREGFRHYGAVFSLFYAPS